RSEPTSLLWSAAAKKPLEIRTYPKNGRSNRYRLSTGQPGCLIRPHRSPRKRKKRGNRGSMQAITKLVSHGRSELAKVIVGQPQLIDGTLAALLCGGHALIEGVPGLGKTLSVKVLARALNVTFQRVQCTSDLMPADLLGSNILNLQNGTFSLHQGPMFT